VKYLSSNELKNILIASNHKNITIVNDTVDKDINCKEENKVVQLNNNDIKLNKIIKEKADKSTFLKNFLRKVF
tara:strand:+ start:394 stop:612 length:219 start_codon:yes stop_codon:yes gene_type:complete